MKHEGSIKVGNSIFYYLVKNYETGSPYGIGGGRISKALIRRNGAVVYNYDRGLDIPPADEETEIALAILMKDYN